MNKLLIIKFKVRIVWRKKNNWKLELKFSIIYIIDSEKWFKICFKDKL